MTTTQPIASGAIPGLKLPRQHREVFLAALVTELTMRARGAYVAGEQAADGSRLRVFNELVNRVSSQLTHSLARTSGYPDQVFLRMLAETAGRGSCFEDLQIAFKQARQAARQA